GAGAQQAEPEGEGDPPAPLRHRRGRRAHARRGGPPLLGDQRAHPPDRDQGPPQAPPPPAGARAQGLRRELILRSPSADTPRAAGCRISGRASRASRATGPGIHQFHVLIRRMVAGTRSARTTVASRTTAMPIPTPTALMMTESARAKAKKTAAMIAPAQGM